jgi:cytochrome c2
VAYQPRQNRNARSALGEPRAQAVVYGVWLTGILTGVILFVLFVFLIGNGINGQRNIQTAKENQGPEVAPLQFSSVGCPTQEPCKVAQVEKWLTDQKSTDAQVAALAKQAYNGALARGQANFARICIGCHYGPPEATSNGPWLGNLYQTGNLVNGKAVNDANVVTFILLGSEAHNLNSDGTTVRLSSVNPDGSFAPRSGGWNPMPAGIASPQQAVDIMLYLKQQTSKK